MPLLQSLWDVGSGGSVHGGIIHCLVSRAGPQSTRGRRDVAKGMNWGGSPSTLTQLCWAWGSGPLPRRILARPSVHVPGPSAPWQQRPRCTGWGEGARVRKRHFPPSATLPMAGLVLLPPALCTCCPGDRICPSTDMPEKGLSLDHCLRTACWVGKELWAADSPGTSRGS